MADGIRRQELHAALAAGVEVARLDEDPRAALADVGQADLDGDGRIDGEREIDAVFALLDRFDGRRDGRVTVARRDGSETAAAPVVDALGEHAHVSSLRALAHAGDPSARIAFVGVTNASVDEARALGRRAPVLLATDRADHADAAQGDDAVTRDLATSAGRGRFVRSLGLPDEVASHVKRVLAQTEPGARREVALLARMWAPAYRGEAVPERLVVSGHGNGQAFLEWDDEELRDVHVRDLAAAMPVAAREVRSIHLAACQHGYDTRLEMFREVFPNLTSAWGYAGFSPTSGTAARHEAAWESASRDAHASDEAIGDAMGAARERVRGTRRGDNVAVWTRDGGWVGPAQRELRLVMNDLAATRMEFQAYYDGEAPLPDPMRGALATRYQWLQEVAAHSDFRDQDPGFRASIQHELDVTLRLRYFERTVTEAFDRHHGREIDAGYRALGMEPPRFHGMTRREVRDALDHFDDVYDANPSPPPAARELRELLEFGLWRLSPDLVPTTWI